MTGRPLTEVVAADLDPEAAAVEALARLADASDAVRHALTVLIDRHGPRHAARVTGLSVGTVRRWADPGPPTLSAGHRAPGP